MPPFQPEPGVIRWRLHLASPPQGVWEALTTDEGRASFWAESAVEKDAAIHFRFPNALAEKARILAREPGKRFSVDYFGSPTTFLLEPDAHGGTDLTLEARDVPENDKPEIAAGWVSVLMALKARVDHKVDLRGHDPDRTWDQGYCEN
jgi:uncharacterized protein YndB with AHSA1/START domain